MGSMLLHCTVIFFMISNIFSPFFRLISFPEFQAFEGLLCLPDALYLTAFQLFDTNGTGLVSFGILIFRFQKRTCHCNFTVQPFIIDNFEEIMKRTTLNQHIPFDLDGEFVRLYFGKEKKRLVPYAEFSQFLHVCIYLF